jgi:hypothetical protein
MLLCRGNIIYQGHANESVQYFSNIGFKCPDFSNPSDYFMEIMNEEGLYIEKMQEKPEIEPKDEELELEFQGRI